MTAIVHNELPKIYEVTFIFKMEASVMLFNVSDIRHRIIMNVLTVDLFDITY